MRQTVLSTLASAERVSFNSSPFVAIPDNAYIGVNDGNDGFGLDAGMVCDTIDTTPALPPGSAIVGDVVVDLGIDHTYIGDLTVKLQSPQGTILALMERVQGDGGSNSVGDNGTASPFGDSTNISSTHIVHFSDAFPIDTESMGVGLASTEAVCADDGVCDYFPNPDQALVVGSSASALADFTGEDPSGPWTLCVGDSAGADVGTFVNWTLQIEPHINLSTSSKTAPDVVDQGGVITYAIDLRNTGSMTLTGAVMTDVIPIGTAFIPGSLSCNMGTCWYDDATNAVYWNGDISGVISGGQVTENYSNTWAISTIGLVNDPDHGFLRYAHESQPDPTIFDIDPSPPHNILGSIQLSAINPGWPPDVDNRTGAAYDPSTGTYFLPDFNGDGGVNYDDNIVEIDAAGNILNAWETDGAGNDTFNSTAITNVIDMAISSLDPFFSRYFVTSAYDGNRIYEIGLIRSGQFISNTWGVFSTCSVPGIVDNLGIDFDQDHGVLYHSDFGSSLIVATDLECNVINSFLCPGPAGFNTGVTYLEGSNPEEILVTDFASNTTTRCTTGITRPNITFGVRAQTKGSVHNLASVMAPDLMAPIFLEADTLVTHDCEVPGNPVTNCSFETGDFTGWITDDLSSPFFPLQVAGDGISSFSGLFLSDPTRGDYAALHGFDGITGTIRVAQDIFLPPDAATLEFDYRAAWDLDSFMPPFGEDRLFQVAIGPSGGGSPYMTSTVLTAYTGTIVPDTGNFLGVVDVSSHADNPVRVSFQWLIPNEFTGPAFFQLDNVFVRTLDADLELTKLDNPDPVPQGAPLNYELIVFNAGPDPATDVVLMDTLPAGVTYLNAIPSQGGCSETGGTVTCNLGIIDSGEMVSVEIEALAPTALGVITNEAIVTGIEFDPDPADNFVSEMTTVVEHTNYLPSVYR
jgi:uncharacterized repeat protein (TIGR01451 family)